MKILHLSWFGERQNRPNPPPASIKSSESQVWFKSNEPLNRNVTMYLLLRNNKQSGPYSLDDLKSMGLKAYDLVWLEGKSAAWRYPCEIEELKPFAPVVEEQPFDRFYRKASAASSTSTSTTLAAKPAADTSVPVTIESTRNSGKRIIYVTMPAARNTQSQVIQPAREPQQPARVASAPVPVTVTEPPKPAYAERTVIEDYSAQVMEEPAPAVEYTPRRSRSPRFIRLLAIGACILALLAAGIIIGLNLDKDTLGFPSRVVAKLPPSNPDQSIVHPTAQSLPAPATTAPADSVRSMDTAVRTYTPSSPIIAQPVVTRATPKLPGAKTLKEKTAYPKNQVNSILPAKDSAAGEYNGAHAVQKADVTEARHNGISTSRDNTEVADKEAVKTALASQVSVGANGYSVGTFGGITDLQLTVTNRSVYPLDLVIVEVQYIQANKKVFKTENLYYHSIGAGAALMQEAPKSSRGVRVQYKITAISSKELGLSYSGI